MWGHTNCETGKHSVPVGPSLLEMCCYVWCFTEMNSFCREKDQIFCLLSCYNTGILNKAAVLES